MTRHREWPACSSVVGKPMRFSDVLRSWTSETSEVQSICWRVLCCHSHGKSGRGETMLSGSWGPDARSMRMLWRGSSSKRLLKGSDSKDTATLSPVSERCSTTSGLDFGCYCKEAHCNCLRRRSRPMILR
jgi:hypothetical protein